MSISIIVVSYNTKELLKDCLESVFRNQGNLGLDIIVVDNASVDGSAEFIKENFPQVKLIASSDNLGFGKANNRGAKIAKGDILLFLNPDTIIEEDIFFKLIDIFSKDKNVGIISPKLILSDHSQQLWAYGEEDKFYDLIKSKIFSKPKVITKSVFNHQAEVGWVSGAALSIRKDIFEKVKGFDENFFMYFEDRDLCYRVKELGYKIVVNNKIQVIHFGGKTPIFNKDRKKIYYQAQNYYWRKRYGLWNSLLMRFIRWPYKFYILRIKK